jgi:GDPmannose 4,6-dehydratase
MKTALITGVTGQDGSYLAEFLIKRGYFVVGMSHSIPNNQSWISNLGSEKFKFVYGSLNDSGTIYRIFATHKFDEVYNLAAQSHVRISFEAPEETVDAVAMGPLRLLECIRNMQPECRLFQASSSEMFANNDDYFKNEISLMNPSSPYACAKFFAHNMIRTYREGYKIHASSGILFNHESPRRGENFVTRKITLAAARIKLGLQNSLNLGNIDSCRDWGYAKDYVEAMWLMLQADRGNDYVISTGESHTVREFLNEVFNYAGLEVNKYVAIQDDLKRPKEQSIIVGDCSKANSLLGWKHATNFKDLAKIMFDADYERELLKIRHESMIID